MFRMFEIVPVFLGVFAIIFYLACFAVLVYIVSIANRFVNAVERIANRYEKTN